MCLSVCPINVLSPRNHKLINKRAMETQKALKIKVYSSRVTMKQVNNLLFLIENNYIVNHSVLHVDKVKTRDVHVSLIQFLVMFSLSKLP